MHCLVGFVHVQLQLYGGFAIGVALEARNNGSHHAEAPKNFATLNASYFWEYSIPSENIRSVFSPRCLRGSGIVFRDAQADVLFQIGHCSPNFHGVLSLAGHIAGLDGPATPPRETSKSYARVYFISTISHFGILPTKARKLHSTKQVWRRASNSEHKLSWN